MARPQAPIMSDCSGSSGDEDDCGGTSGFRDEGSGLPLFGGRELRKPFSVCLRVENDSIFKGRVCLA